MDFDRLHVDDAASPHDSRPQARNHINNASPDLESRTSAAINKTAKKGKDDTSSKPTDDARHITFQSEHHLTNGSAEGPRI
jgi:hypothetical protein